MVELTATPLQEEVQSYGSLLSEIAAPTFLLTEYPFGDRMPHTWKVVRMGGQPEQVDIFELEPIHLLEMRRKTENEKRQYLRERFTPYFDRLRGNADVG